MSAESEGRAKANAYRNDRELGVQPLGDLVALIEQLEDIDVALMPVDDPEAHGLSMSDPATGRVRIAAACTPHPMRQRSTLAHELGHVLFGDHSDPDFEGWGEYGPIEIRATAFARHLLVPLEGLKAVLGPPNSEVTEATVSMLVQRYLASPQIVTIQLCEAGYINDAQKRAWSSLSAPRLAVRYGWSEQYQALSLESTTHRSPQLLLARATEGYLLNVVSLSALARVRRTDPDCLQAEFHDLGLTPAEPDYTTSDPTGLIGPSGGDDVNLDELDAALAAEESPGNLGDDQDGQNQQRNQQQDDQRHDEDVDEGRR